MVRAATARFSLDMPKTSGCKKKLLIRENLDDLELIYQQLKQSNTSPSLNLLSESLPNSLFLVLSSSKQEIIKPSTNAPSTHFAYTNSKTDLHCNRLLSLRTFQRIPPQIHPIGPQAETHPPPPQPSQSTTPQNPPLTNPCKIPTPAFTPPSPHTPTPPPPPPPPPQPTSPPPP